MGQVYFNKFHINRIWAAVLLQACEDIVSPTDTDKPDTRRALRRQALAWVTSTRTDECSFISVCLNLCINPNIARQKILQLPRYPGGRKKRLRSLFISKSDLVMRSGEVQVYG